MATPKPLSTEDKLLDWFKPDLRELERHNDPEKIRMLAENMKARGQLQNVAATEIGAMIYGHGRLLAAPGAGMKALRTVIYPASLTDKEFRLIRAAENLQRSDWTGHHKWLFCSDLLCGNPGWTQKELAVEMNLDPAQMTRILSPSKCTVQWQEALKAGKVSISDCYAASKLEPEAQGGLLALKLSGASRDDLERAGKKKRNGQADTVRLEKVTVALPGGRKAIISGQSLGMGELVDLLTEMLKEAKKAADTFDVKTWVKMMADKARG